MWVHCEVWNLPYFVELLNSQLKDLEYFVALFVESFNCFEKKKKKKKNGGLAHFNLGFQQKHCGYKVLYFRIPW